MTGAPLADPVGGKPTRWRPWLTLGLLLLAAMTTATWDRRWGWNPLEAPSPAPLRKAGLAPVKLRDTQGPAGHRSVAIDEGNLGGDARSIGFGLLERWAYAADAPASPPAEIQLLNGTRVTLAGFMFPLAEGERVTAFCLTASTQTCCYGPRPQFNQFVLVEVPEPVPFERMRPVYVSGILRVEPRPADGYIYRMEGEWVVVAPDEEVTGVRVAAGTPVFPLGQLDRVRPEQAVEPDRIAIPASLTALDGTRVQVHGYVLARFRGGEPPPLLVANDWWDGCCQGVPPDIFNSLLVKPASDAAMPDRWYDPATFTGVLRFNSPRNWSREGIFQVVDARLVKENVP